MNSAPGKGPCAGRKALPHTTAGLRHSLWLDQHRRFQNRALFDVAIDSKLYGCDVVKVRIGDIVTGSSVRDRAVLVGRKPNDPCNLKSSSKSAKPRPLARASRRHVKRLHLPPPATIIWHSLASTHDGINHLQADKKSTRNADFPWSCEREHGPLPWRRCRRRVGALKADGGLNH